MGEQAYNLHIVPVGLVGPAARAYESAVRIYLSRIWGTESGRVLLNSIRYWNVPVNISPYDGSEDPCNASQTSDPGSKPGVLYPTVLYSPETWRAEGRCAIALARSGQTAGQLPHEVLLHEIVHAFRTISLSARPNPVYTYDSSRGGLHRYDNEEEFIAVMVTNIYISDPTNRNHSEIRADHATGYRLDKGLAGSFEFFRSSAMTFRVVDKLCKLHPGLTGALAKVPAAFNPLAAYYMDPDKALRNSTQPAAYERDATGYEDQFFNRLKKQRADDRKNRGF